MPVDLDAIERRQGKDFMAAVLANYAALAAELRAAREVVALARSVYGGWDKFDEAVAAYDAAVSGARSSLKEKP